MHAFDTDGGTARLEPSVLPTFRDVLGLRPRPDLIAIDIPIGVPDVREPGGRACDRDARKLLGPRRNSVFSAPTRDLLAAQSYDEVRSRGMSRQAFGILPKIREVDAIMTPALQRRVREAHPELAFLALAGAPMRHPKRLRAGRRERLEALRSAAGPRHRIERAYRAALERSARADVAHDDVLDALALVTVAMRISARRARRVPELPTPRPRDARGLRMEIWF